MSFMNSLMSNPSGGISGQPGQGVKDPLGLVNNLKDREMQDFQNKANFMSDLSIKQDRLRRLYGLDGNSQGQQQQSQTTSIPDQQASLSRLDPNNPNNPGAMQKAELGIRQQQANTESQRVNQQGQFGQEAIDIKQQQTDLNQQKSDSIHDQKLHDAQQKADEATAKMGLEHDKLQANINDHEQHVKFLNAKAEADAARTAAQHAQIEAAHAETKRKDDATIADLQEKAKGRNNKTTTTTVNPEGTQRTTNTRSGSAAQNVIKTNPDQTLHVSGGPKTSDNPSGEYDIPPDKLDHWNSTYGDQSFRE